MFLKVDGITGESTDDKHRGEIDVLSWSWGESTGTARTSRGPLAAACIQDMSLTKYIDSSSPALIMNAMSGEVVPTAVLVVRKSGETQFDFLRITMKNVSVTAFQTGGSGGEDRITENVVLHFESMQGQYHKQRADGTADAPITWNISAANSGGCR
ncbi:MAG: type VI secretion system tube protein Hcp [Acidobacteriota bacterium]|nr:type VI secretion system tube protein Hcp [Acidobacteriota bacterium]